MHRTRIATAGLVLLAVACIATGGVWFLFVDAPPIAESDLNATRPDPTVATAPAEFAMTVEVRSRSTDDGSEQANWSAGVAYDAAARARLAWLNSTAPDSGVSITAYQRYARNATHSFVRYHAADAEQFDHRAGSIREDLDPGTEALRVDDASNTYWYYRKGARSEFEIVPEGIFYFGFVHAIPFERAGTTTLHEDDVEKYVPVTGWTRTAGSVADGPDTYVFEGSGSLYVSEETGNIVRANVSITSKRTDARAGAWFGDGGNRAQFTLTVSEEVDVEELKPGWTREPPFDEQ